MGCNGRTGQWKLKRISSFLDSTNLCLTQPCLNGGTCKVSEDSKSWYCVCRGSRFKPPDCGKRKKKCDTVSMIRLDKIYHSFFLWLLPVCLSSCLSICLCFCLPVSLSVFLSLVLSVCLSFCLSLVLSVCQYVCLSVCVYHFSLFFIFLFQLVFVQPMLMIVLRRTLLAIIPRGYVCVPRGYNMTVTAMSVLNLTMALLVEQVKKMNINNWHLIIFNTQLALDNL